MKPELHLVSGAENTKPKPENPLQADLLASLVVFLVALPLSLGIALASGAPARAGIISACVGGIVVGLLSGVPLQVSGAAAGLTVVVFQLQGELGFPATCLITCMAGVLQIALGTARLARFALVISPAVVHGMLAGIGLLIALGQVHVILGGLPLGSALANVSALPDRLRTANWSAAALGVMTIALILLWDRLAKSQPRCRVIPSSLLAVAVARAPRVQRGAGGAACDRRGGSRLASSAARIRSLAEGAETRAERGPTRDGA